MMSNKTCNTVTVSSFHTLWQGFEKELTNFVRSKLFDKSLVQDVMQEVAIKIYQNQTTVSTTTNVRAFLYTLTKNCLIDFYRKHSKKLPNGIFFEEVSKDDELHIALECLPIMIEKLPITDQEILRLRVQKEYSIKEISEILHLSIEGVKSKLKRAHVKLGSNYFTCCSVEKNKRGDIITLKGDCTKGC